MRVKNNSYLVLGIMSGTSCDGLDMALTSYWLENEKWHFRIEKAMTIPYTQQWEDALIHAHEIPAVELFKLDVELGRFIGQSIRNFLIKIDRPDFIATHGHTVFHQPPIFTLQIGNGNAIYAETNIPVICDFRSVDVALGGQGAPLVPIGDKHLFQDYELCVNIGGFANISFDTDKKERIAFDICAANMVLNTIAKRVDLSYDHGGETARRGDLCEELLHTLNALLYYKAAPPKSLGKEWVIEYILPLLNEQFSPADLLRTYVEHIAMQIGRATSAVPRGKMLLTGGGAWNTFLVERIKIYAEHTVVVPQDMILQFKEAVIFGFLGVLKMRGENNTLQSVTGASRDSCGGYIIG